MKKSELNKLKELVNKEVEKRNRIQELLRNELVQEYLEKTNTEPSNLRPDNLYNIINQILEDFTITETNGIYVCTYAYYIDRDICYQEINEYVKEVNIDSKKAENKLYIDIENNKPVFGVSKSENTSSLNVLIKNFEKENIVLNPTNNCLFSNGYDKVKTEFFLNTLEYGQVKSKKLLLDKYPRLK